MAGHTTAPTAEDTATTIAVLANDSDADGDALTVSVGSQPAHGTATVNADQTITYTPAANYNGGDTFTYAINDGHGGTATATVNVTVTAVNNAPVAVNDAVTMAEDTAVSGNVLANDTDADAGTTLTAPLVASPTHGTVTLAATGAFTYTPAANYNGSDTFTYKANDGTVDSNVATVAITITAVNDAPVAVNDSVTTAEDIAVTSNVLTNDT